MAYGTMIKLTASDGDIDTTDNLVMFEAFGKAIILNGTYKKVADFSNVKLATAAVGTHPPDHGNILTGGTSGAKMRVDYITTLTGACVIYGLRSTTATFSSGETVTGLDDDGNTISFVTSAAEVTAPHWYSLTTYGNSTTFGTLATKLYIGCMYIGRMYVAGDPSHPFQWYASRQENIWDFLYNADDAQSPITGGDIEVGVSQDVIKALIPCGNDYLLFGCENSFYVMLGDPGQGASMKTLPTTTGIFGATSWCFDEQRNIYFWGQGGIYKIAADLSSIDNVTQFKLPTIIKDEVAVSSTHRITMAFDVNRHGILVNITKLADATNTNYWYEQRTDGFFYETYPTECGVYSTFFYNSNTASQKDLLLGCADGYIRKFDDTQNNDDIGTTNETIDSYVTFGPFALSKDIDGEGIINNIRGILGGGATGGSKTDSNNVTYYIYSGDSPEQVMEKVYVGTYSATGTVYAPGYQRGKRQIKGVRGRWGAIRLRNATASQGWNMESIEVDITPDGRLS